MPSFFCVKKIIPSYNVVTDKRRKFSLTNNIISFLSDNLTLVLLVILVLILLL